MPGYKTSPTFSDNALIPSIPEKRPDPMQRKAASSVEKKLEDLSFKCRSMKANLSSLHKENKELRGSLIKKESLLENLPTGLAVIQSGVIREINRKALETLGYASEDLLGGDFMDLVLPSFRAFVTDVHEKRLRGKRATHPYEVELLTKPGVSVVCEMMAEKIRYEGRNAILLLLESLEGRRTKERDLIRAQKAELVETMVAGLLRSINPAVQGIRDHLHRTRESLVSGKRVTPANLDSASTALSQLADLSRALEGLARVKREGSGGAPFDLGKVVQEAIVQVTEDLKEHDPRGVVPINFKTYLRQVSPVEGDPGEIKAAMISLIRNAVEAMPGGGDLYISAEENAGFAHVYVQDSGGGIPEEIQPRVRDPFFSTKGRHAEGLGLSLATAILNRHRGELEIEARKGQGTTVTLRIPLWDGRGKGKTGRARRRIRNARVLVIEEEHMLREILSHVLSSRGYRVTSAEGVSEGLDRLKAKGFHLVIVGSVSDRLQGVKLFRRIRRVDSRAALAVIQPQGDGSLSEELKGAMVDLVLHKPIDMSRALEQISEIL